MCETVVAVCFVAEHCNACPETRLPVVSLQRYMKVPYPAEDLLRTHKAVTGTWRVTSNAKTYKKEKNKHAHTVPSYSPPISPPHHGFLQSRASVPRALKLA